MIFYKKKKVKIGRVPVSIIIRSSDPTVPYNRYIELYMSN